MDTKLVLSWLDQRLHELSGAAVVAAGTTVYLDPKIITQMLGPKAGIAVAVVGAYQLYKARQAAPAAPAPVPPPESKP